MSDFECRVWKVGVEDHPNADRLEQAVVGGYRCAVRKGEFSPGDLAAYIEEGSVLPQWLIERMGLEGRLAGANKDRVKAVKLRGVLSQGLVLRVEGGLIEGEPVSEGDDVAELLELTKYVPPVLRTMGGTAEGAGGRTVHYDIENLKKYPHAFEPGEPVFVTEKLHGSWCCLGWHPSCGPVVTSKGLSAQGVKLKQDDPANERNIYVTAWNQHRERFEELRSRLAPGGTALYVLGEVFGQGVQDLHYGLTVPAFAVFDVFLGDPGKGVFINAKDLAAELDGGFDSVPFLGAIPFDLDEIAAMTDGVTSLGGVHIREGVVVKPEVERRHDEIGRLCLKNVSGDYLTRKGGSEYN